MYYKGCIIKDRKIPTTNCTLTEEGMNYILTHQDVPLVNSVYQMVTRCKLIRDGDDIFAVATFDPQNDPFRDYDVDEWLGYVFFSAAYLSIEFSKDPTIEISEIVVDRISLDFFDKRYIEQDPETAEFMRLRKYFTAEDAYAKTNQKTNTGSN